MLLEQTAINQRQKIANAVLAVSALHQLNKLFKLAKTQNLH